MARKAATAAAPSPDQTGGAGTQEKTAEQIAADAAAAQAKADEEAKALEEAERLKAEQEAQAKEKEERDAADAVAAAQAKADEEAKAAPAAEVWSLPVVEEFPATLTITNATPCKFHVVGTDVEVEAGTTDEVTFETEKSYKRFVAHMSQIAELRGWVQGEGVTAEAQHGEE
jgi:hypothetical protein